MVQFDEGNITQANQRVTASIDDQIFKRCNGIKPANGAQQIATLAAFYFAAGNVTVTRPDRVPHVENGKLTIRKPCRVQQYPDLPFRATRHIDL